jgi:hypothetical protein
VELDIRNIKTTLGWEVLQCLTPQMVEKELWVSLLTYNVIRLLVAQAAHTVGVHPRELSFRHTVQMWTTWSWRVREIFAAPEVFFRLLAQQLWAKRGGAASNLELESDDLSRFPGSRCLEVWRAARYALMVTCYALK